MYWHWSVNCFKHSYRLMNLIAMNGANKYWQWAGIYNKIKRKCDLKKSIRRYRFNLCQNNYLTAVIDSSLRLHFPWSYLLLYNSNFNNLDVLVLVTNPLHHKQLFRLFIYLFSIQRKSVWIMFSTKSGCKFPKKF